MLQHHFSASYHTGCYSVPCVSLLRYLVVELTACEMATCYEYIIFWCIYHKAMAESHARGVLWPRASKAEGESSGKERPKRGKLHFVSAQSKKSHRSAGNLWRETSYWIFLLKTFVVKEAYETPTQCDSLSEKILADKYHMVITAIAECNFSAAYE